jgi:glycosyltransferase involved in cell wall biosynthesis
MRILFVFRNHLEGHNNPIIVNQSGSLIKMGIEVDFFTIKNGGLEYLRIFINLKKHLQKHKYDLVHAHYGYTAIIVGLANSGKTIASLMGSDIYRQNHILLFITRLCSKFLWHKTIVKSLRMKETIQNSIVIANGVNIELFKQYQKGTSRLEVGFTKEYNIIFIATSPEERVKNLILAKQAVSYIRDTNIQLHIVSNLSSEKLSLYYSAADLLILTSTSEGSPNVIKEAMACNCPIVSTDVGDVKEVIGNTEGCYLTSFSYIDVADKIKLALEFSRTTGRTNGRNRIIQLGLDSESTAKRIIEVYDRVLNG